MRLAGEAPFRVRRADAAIRLDARLAEAVWLDADSIVVAPAC